MKAAMSRQNKIKLADLIPGSTYVFRIKAENPYGVSNPSPEAGPVYLLPNTQRFHSPYPFTLKSYVITHVNYFSTDSSWNTGATTDVSKDVRGDAEDTTVSSSILPRDSDMQDFDVQDSISLPSDGSELVRALFQGNVEETTGGTYSYRKLY